MAGDSLLGIDEVVTCWVSSWKSARAGQSLGNVHLYIDIYIYRYTYIFGRVSSSKSELWLRGFSLFHGLWDGDPHDKHMFKQV